MYLRYDLPDLATDTETTCQYYLYHIDCELAEK